MTALGISYGMTIENNEKALMQKKKFLDAGTKLLLVSVVGGYV